MNIEEQMELQELRVFHARIKQLYDSGGPIHSGTRGIKAALDEHDLKMQVVKNTIAAVQPTGEKGYGYNGEQLDTGRPNCWF